MMLLNRNWEPLVVGEELAVTIDSLLALLLHLPFISDCPEGSGSLEKILSDQGLLNLVITNRIGPLMMAVSRQCTSSRAPAIMAVLGATKWF
jgi:hypothetical protein